MTERLNTHTHTHTHTAVTVFVVDGVVGVAALQLREHMVAEGGVSGFQNQSDDSWLGIQQVQPHL